MERYERVEQIDYKSARDVVTEVDHLSEALILDAIRAAFPGDALLGEESGGHDGGARRPDRDLRPRARLGRRSARRDDQLRQRHPVLLRLDRPRRGRPAGRRRRPRPVARRVVRGGGRRAGDARRAGDPRLGQGEAERLRHLDGARRAGGRDPGPRGPQGDPGAALDGLGGAGPRLRRQRALRCLRPAGRPLDLGHRRGRAHRRAGRRDGHGPRRAVRGSRSRPRPSPSACSPPRPPTTGSSSGGSPAAEPSAAPPRVRGVSCGLEPTTLGTATWSFSTGLRPLLDGATSHRISHVAGDRPSTAA